MSTLSYTLSSHIFDIFINLLSYDAAEDNEITFRENDIITEIEPASEDWWQGKNSRGEVGLFPGESSFFYLNICVMVADL